MTPLNPAYAARLHNLQAGLLAAGSDPMQAAQQAQALLYGQLLRQSSMLAFVDVFRALAWICLGLIPLMLLMKPTKRGGATPPVH
jgi:DHA2 family multidrug resistance protein